MELVRKLIFISLFASQLAFAAPLLPLPGPPRSPENPGSKIYPYEYTQTSINCGGRDVVVFLPKSETGAKKQFPVIVFGHGQATNLSNYEADFVHLARKGAAIIFPIYDNGFFDQDWKRMGHDYDDLTDCALHQFSDSMNRNEVIYSGHSKGGYIALAAAGTPEPKVKPKALVVFEPAGYVEEILKNFDPKLPVTLVWSEADTIVSRALVHEVYNKLQVTHKQFLTLKNYSTTDPKMDADHYYPMSKGFFGQSQENPFQYYNVWKLLLGAKADIEAGSPHTNTYIYGAQAVEKGIPDLKDLIERN